MPERIAFDVTHGPPISLERAQAVINAVVAEAKKRDRKMNIDVVVVRDGKTLVELTYARENKLPVALIQNRAGAWVEPIAAAATAAIEAFRDDLANDVRIPVVDPPPSAKDASRSPV